MFGFGWLREVLKGRPAKKEAEESPTSLAAYNQLRENISEAAKHARTLFMAHVAVTAYGIVTIATLADRDFFGQGAQVKLPVVDVVVSTDAFFLGLPVLSVVMVLYFYAYLSHTRRLLRTARQGATALSSSGDVVPLSSVYLYPWISFFDGSLARCSFALLAWGATPALCLVACWRLARFDSSVPLWKSDGPPSAYVFWWLAMTVVSLCSWIAQQERGGDPPSSLLKRVALAAVPLALGALVSRNTLYDWLGSRPQLVGARISLTAVANEKELGGARLLEDTVVGARLNGVQLSGAALRAAYLDRAKLAHANLEAADLTAARLREAVLVGAHLCDAWLERSDLSGASLAQANASGADFGDANLAHASLVGANLAGATLVGAILTGARLESARLEAANLRGAELQSADLDGAYFDEETAFPDGFDPVAASMVPSSGRPPVGALCRVPW